MNVSRKALRYWHHLIACGTADMDVMIALNARTARRLPFTRALWIVSYDRVIAGESAPTILVDANVKMPLVKK